MKIDLDSGFKIAGYVIAAIGLAWAAGTGFQSVKGQGEKNAEGIERVEDKVDSLSSKFDDYLLRNQASR